MVDLIAAFSQVNFLDAITSELKSQKLILNPDNTISDGPFRTYDLDSPWVHNGNNSGRNCYLWKDIYLHNYRILSRNCFNCWKIVLRFNKITELFEINALQERLHKSDPKKYNSKCGIEIRPWCGAGYRYAAFWYTSMAGSDHFDRGKQLASDLRQILSENSLPSMIKLKRGCTEMEDIFGASNSWQYDKNSNIENILDNIFNVSPTVRTQPMLLKTYIYLSWLRRAYYTNDSSLASLTTDVKRKFGIIDIVDYLKEENKDIVLKSVTGGKINELKDGRISETSNEEQSAILTI